MGVLYGRESWLDAMPPFLGGGSMIDFGEDHEASRFLLLNRVFKSRDGFVHFEKWIVLRAQSPRKK